MVEAPTAPSVPARSGHPRARRLFLLLSGIAGLALAVGAALSIATIHHVEATITKLPVEGKHCTGTTCLTEITQTCAQNICDFLILGSDTRSGLSKGQQSQFGTTKTVAGQRADTIILVRVDPVHNRTVVLSLPRDLLVNIPGHGMGKINTAFDYGPNTMVKTVKEVTGLPINHYVEINFAGFENLINALGGIPICTNRPLKDPLSGLNLPHKGCYDLKGYSALAYVRARHVEGDIIPDFSRIARQQQFMRAVIQKAQSIGEIFHIPSLIKAVQSNLTIDAGLNLYALQDLTRKLASLGQAAVQFRAAPATPLTINGVDYVQLIEPDAATLFTRIRDGKRLGSIGIELPGTAISPANITVRVFDASSGGKAQSVLTFLQQAGFVVLPVEPAPAGLSDSEILYRNGEISQAQVVASYTSSNLLLKANATYTTGVDCTIVIGADFRGIEGA